MKQKLNTECICTKCGSVKFEYSDHEYFNKVKYVPECNDCFTRKSYNLKIRKLAHLKLVRSN